jgi:hypothetical protein
MKITNQQYVEAAQRLYDREGETEVDDGARVSRGDAVEDGDAGAYVQAWVWVSNEDIEQ